MKAYSAWLKVLIYNILTSIKVSNMDIRRDHNNNRIKGL